MPRVHALLFICPECRKVANFVADKDNTFNYTNIICGDDGYLMKCVKLDDFLIDKLTELGKL